MGSKRKSPFSTKYHTDPSGEFEPGSKGLVLKNLLGLKTKDEIEKEELRGYYEAEKRLHAEFGIDQQLHEADIKHINKLFLGHLYSWAGAYRTVNLSKGGFPFASAMAIPSATKEFDKSILSVFTPCRGDSQIEIAHKIAVVHVEFLLIHPFREGNGRTARLLALVMAYQAGLPSLRFDFIDDSGAAFKGYVAAIQQGINRDYSLMKEIILRAIERALRFAGGA